MDEIPSALERALEKVEKLGKASPEELRNTELVERGQKLAAQYLKGETSLLVEMNKHDEGTRERLVEGAQEILIRNIVMPSDDTAKRETKSAMEGLKLIKQDKARIENVFSKIRQLFNHYTSQGETQKKEAYENLKVQMQATMRQTVQQQMGVSMDMPNIEQHPQFQVEWRRIRGQMDSQYLTHLKEYKEELAAIS